MKKIIGIEKTQDATNMTKEIDQEENTTFKWNKNEMNCERARELNIK